MPTTERPAVPAGSTVPLTLRLIGRETTVAVEPAVTLTSPTRPRVGARSCRAVAVIAEDRAHGAAESREAMSANVCRCGAYPNVAVASAV